MNFEEMSRRTRWQPAFKSRTIPTVTVIIFIPRSTPPDVLEDLERQATAAPEEVEFVLAGDGLDREPGGSANWIIHQDALDWPGPSAVHATLKARGEVILFARPGWNVTEVCRELLGTRVEAAGWLLASVLGKGERPLVPPVRSAEILDAYNPFDCCCLAVRRSLLSTVGLPDPHIALGEHWLWDYASRLSRAAPLRHLRAAATAHKTMLDAEPIFTMVPAPVIAFAATSRNALLHPDAIASRNVIDVPETLWSCAKAHIAAKASRYGWRTTELPHTPTVDRPPVDRPMLIVGEHTASVSLYFDGLPAEWRAAIRFLPPAQPEAIAMSFAGAGAVVVARDLRLTMESGLFALLRRLEIPVYAFLDDNFVVLGQEIPEFAYYSHENLKMIAQSGSRLIVTSGALAQWFRDQGIADPWTWPCVLDEALIALRRPTELAEFRVGMAGDPFRGRVLSTRVAAALRMISADFPVRLFVRDDVERPSGVRTETIPFDPSFRGFIHRWRALGLHALVHPTGDTANLPFKTANALLVARYTGAVPVVSTMPPYDEFGEADGVLRVSGEPESWEKALRRLLDDDFRAEMQRRLEAACRRHFAAAPATKVMRDILNGAPQVDVAERDRREPIIAAWIATRTRARWASFETPVAQEPEPLSLRYALRQPRKAFHRMMRD